MIFLGLVIAAAAVGVGVAVVLDNTDTAQLTLFGEAIPGITGQWHVFAAGAAVAVVFMSGMLVVVLGVVRAVRVRRELRDLRDEHEESLTTLEMEKRHLQRELARARREQSPIVPAPQQGASGSAMAAPRFFDSSAG
jgi:uncharacterized integral membrane protein